MRKPFIALFAALTLFAAGCAGGFRLGGNNYGVGLGGYVGPTPDAVRHVTPGHYPPPG